MIALMLNHFAIFTLCLVIDFIGECSRITLIHEVLTINCSTSLSIPTLGKSGIMWATTLKPASLDSWKDSHTARTVCPLEKVSKFGKYI